MRAQATTALKTLAARRTVVTATSEAPFDTSDYPFVAPDLVHKMWIDEYRALGDRLRDAAAAGPVKLTAEQRALRFGGRGVFVGAASGWCSVGLTRVLLRVEWERAVVSTRTGEAMKVEAMKDLAKDGSDAKTAKIDIPETFTVGKDFPLA